MNHKYITNKLFIEDNKTISDVTNLRYKDDNHIFINFHITINHEKICIGKKIPAFHEKSESKRLRDEDKEKIIRAEMEKNKDISTKELHGITRFGMDTISRYYMKIRRENSRKSN